MKTKRLVLRALVAAVFGAALLLGASPLVTDAEAGRKHRGRKPHVVAHHKRVVRHHAPVVVVQRPPLRPVRPWYHEARTVYVDRSPFFFNVGLGVYLGGGVHLGLAFGNTAPAGFIYADPYCDQGFITVAAYHRHLRHHHHPAALRVVRVDACGY